METENSKSHSFSYSNFLNFRRGKTKVVKNVAKNAISQENASHIQKPVSFNFPPAGHLEETLQFKVGKLVVENSDLSYQLLELEGRLHMIEKCQLKDYSTQCSQVEELENLVEPLKLALEQSRARTTELQLMLNEANIKLNDYASRASLSADEKTVDYLNTIRLFEEKCEELERKNHIEQQENEDKVKQFHLLLDAKSKDLEKCAAASVENETEKYPLEIRRLKQEQQDLQISLRSLSRELEQIENSCVEKEREHDRILEKMKTEQDELLWKCITEKETFEAREVCTKEKFKELEQLLAFERQKTKELGKDLQRVAACQNQVKENTISDLEKKLANVVAENEFIRRQNSVTINETLVDVEKKLHHSEIQRARLAKDFAERIAQDRALKEQMQKEYERRITELGLQLEEDYKRKSRLAEEQAEQKTFELKTECEKIRDIHSQYREMVDKRLEQHSKNIKEQHRTEFVQLQMTIKKLEETKKAHKLKLANFHKALDDRESELRATSLTSANLQKKIIDLESALAEVNAHCTFLNSDLEKLRQIKDPSTIVQTTLAAERESLARILEIEYSKKVASFEDQLRTSLKAQFEEQRGRLENEVKLCREQISELKQQISQQNFDTQKKRAEFTDKKRSLEERINLLTEQGDSIKKSVESTHETELKTIRESNERLLKKMKQEKSDALKSMENSHLIELQALEDRFKTEKSYLLRQHREEQRNLLASIEEITGRNLLEFQQLQTQNIRLIEDRQKMCAETELSCNRILEQMKNDHQKNLRELEARNAELLARSRQMDSELTTVKVLLTEAENQTATVKYTLEREMLSRIEQSERTAEETQSKIRQEYEKKLAIFQHDSVAQTDHMDRQLQLLVKKVRRNNECEKELKSKLEITLARNEELERNQFSIQKKLSITVEGISNVCSRYPVSKTVKI